MNMKKTAASAVLLSAIMLLVVAAPLVVTADTHHIIKGDGGPRASAVSWQITRDYDGLWYGHIVNSGLRTLVIEVEDITSGVPISMMTQRIRFAAYPTNVVDAGPCVMSKDRVYLITATPNGPKGSSCYVEDLPYDRPPPVPSFVYAVDGATVTVDASASTGAISDYGWDWGDGSTGLGVMASHTYSAPGKYAIILTVIDVYWVTASTNREVVIPDNPPVAMFTVTMSGLMASVNASLSTDDFGIVKYSYDFGDGYTLTWDRPTATKQYNRFGTFTITLTVTDSAGQTSSCSLTVVIIEDNPPTASFTVSSSGMTVNVDASGSTDDLGIVLYSWTWGDGTTDHYGAMEFSHTYPSDGTYTIVLEVMDSTYHKASVSQQVNITGEHPEVMFTGVTASGGLLTVDASYSTSSYGIASYDWNFGDHIVASGVTHVHRYYFSSSFEVTLTVTDILGNTAAVRKTFSVTASGIPPLAYTVLGYTMAQDESRIGSCDVTVTNPRIGETLIDSKSDTDGFYYIDNVMMLWFQVGDTMILGAEGTDGLSGTASLQPNFGGIPYTWANITLNGSPLAASFTSALVLPNKLTLDPQHQPAALAY